MKKYILKINYVFIFFITFQTFSQQNFPESWEGNYEGELQIYGVDSVQMKLTMKLNIHKESDSIFQWKMIYNLNGKDDIRAYKLKVLDKKRGHYTIDELNTIIINGYYKSEIFTSFFEVMDSFIVSTYRKKDDETIIFEIIAANRNN